MCLLGLAVRNLSVDCADTASCGLGSTTGLFNKFSTSVYLYDASKLVLSCLDISDRQRIPEKLLLLHLPSSLWIRQSNVNDPSYINNYNSNTQTRVTNMFS